MHRRLGGWVEGVASLGESANLLLVMQALVVIL